jgi:hypothetical protein
MSGSEFQERRGRQREKSDALQPQLASVVEAFRELFNLLEEYAPPWYTEEHHNRAVAALRSFEESRHAKAQAARSQKAG